MKRKQLMAIPKIPFMRNKQKVSFLLISFKINDN